MHWTWSCCLSLLIMNIVSQAKISNTFLRIIVFSFKRDNMDDFIIYLGAFLSGTVCLVVFYAFGQQMTSHFENLVEQTYECNCYRLSVKQQKHFLLMIMVQQEPIYLHGLSTVQCIYDMFKRVLYFRIKINIWFLSINFLSDQQLWIFIFYDFSWFR